VFSVILITSLFFAFLKKFSFFCFTLIDLSSELGLSLSGYFYLYYVSLGIGTGLLATFLFE
jgi:hypothetical protein